MIRRVLFALVFITTALFGVMGPASAHGIGGRTDLPLPAWQLVWAAGFAVASSFVALGAFWSTPRLADAAVGRSLLSVRTTGMRVLFSLTRLFGLFLFVIVLIAAWAGNINSAVNLSGDAFLIWFWVGLQVASFLIGDVWRLFNPFETIADGAAWLWARTRGQSLEPVNIDGMTLWPAVGSILVYLWYELAYHSTESPRSIGVFLAVYSVAVLGGAVRHGRSFVRTAEGFAVLFGKLAAMAPLFVEDGRLRARSPLTGLSRLPHTPGTVPFVLVVLGSTTFDGFTRSSFWLGVAGGQVGWDRTITSTVGLLVIVGLVAMVYFVAMSMMSSLTGEDASELSEIFGPTLVPIAAAYAVAHYFSLLVLDGQRMIIQISDPLGKGWDLFGTKDYAIDFTLVSPSVIAWVQTLAIAVGHVLAVAAAHDVAISRYDHRTAVRSQYPMLFVMILYTVIGLFLLLGA
ncbi:MAG: hypothetical protein HOJ56_15635 [Acidimicrobiaceae bacterium]|jgi:hypothetical protein|nr:hypothetical protein [Acidimicrobiaceae bacterium]